MNFSSNIFQSEAPPFVDLGIPSINTFNESGVLGTPATSILRPKNGSHWASPNNVFGEATAVGKSTARSDQDYSYKKIFKFGGKIRYLSAKTFQ